MINKSQFSITNDKKLLRKIGKKWVVVGTLALALLGGGVVMSTTVTHADTAIPAVKAQATNKVKKQINNNLDKAYQIKNNAQSGSRVNEPSASSSSASQSSNISKPSNIQSKATNMYRGLMMNAIKPSNSLSASSASSRSSVASSGSVSASAKPSFNSAYQSYMAKMSGTDSEVASVNDKNIQSDAKDKRKPLIKDNETRYQTNFSDNHWIYDNGKYLSDNSTNDWQNSSSDYYGLSYKYSPSLKAIEFTNGTLDWSDISQKQGNTPYPLFIGSTASDDYAPKNISIYDIQSIKFDNNVDLHMTPSYPIYGCLLFDTTNPFDDKNSILHSVVFPTSSHRYKVSNISDMFGYNSDLDSIDFGNTFEFSLNGTAGVMFRNDERPNQITIGSPSERFQFSMYDSGAYHKQLPEKDPQGDNYTLSTPNDFSQGNVGTFVQAKNPAPTSDNAIVNFQYNDKIIKSVTIPKQKFNSNINLDNFVPNDYELNNPNQVIKANGYTYTVPVKINYDAIINSLVNEASSESTAIASYEASSTSISNADKWVQSNSNSAQSADSWIASNSSNATHASSQASTNSSAISSLSTSTNANHSADNSNIVSLSNSVASASNAISSNSTANSSIVNSLASSASHAMVVGTAYLTLLYKKGNRTDGQVLRLHINGNIGDSDIVINPQDYDRDGYSVAPSDKDWHIPFDYKDVKHATNDFSRYNVENTFTYQAQPISINIDYVDTQTHQRVPNSSIQNLSDIAYDGDTIDLQGTDSNSALSVDGNKYQLNLPAGYHLANTNNYIEVTANGTYTKQVPNGAGNYHTVRMPLMKLTLGITPHFNKHNNKPASTSSVVPVKPSSASSVTPSSASSVQSSSAKSVQPSSASSMAPSSASQSVAPSSTASVTPIVLPSSEASSTSKPSSIAPASSSVKPTYASASPAPSKAEPVVHKAINHKSMAKHSEARLNHSISQATHQLSTVERHMKARKATETKAIHKLVHAKKTIKRSQHKLTYLRHNKRHVAHALRRITRNKVAIKHAKRVIHIVKTHRAKRVTESKVTKPTVKSIKTSVNASRAKANSANQPTGTKKLPQTGEANYHAGLAALIITMAAGIILAGFGKLFSRKRTE